MLEPNERALLHDILRPPADHHLDIAVGTTYSLDLVSMLSAPVSFALFDVESASLGEETGSLEILESVRRYADRTTVFAMAGQISVPANYRSVFSYLEDSIVPVRRPMESRVFHPKLWLLRFVSDESSAYLHRIVVLSRNLTYDASWDISAVLDEAPEGSGEQCAEPLGGLLAWLQGQSTRDLPSARRNQLSALASTISQAQFQVPVPFTSMRLWPLGPGLGSMREPEACDRALVISPFVSADRIDAWRAAAKNLTLISREEEIDRLPVNVIPPETYVLSPYVRPNEEDAGELSGLHAKVYVADRGKESTWWIGSANATRAAFNGNAEFLLELTGSTGSVGVKKLLADVEGEVSLLSLLEPYRRSEDVSTDGEPARESIEDQILIELAESGLHLEVGPEVVDGPRTIYPLTLTSTVDLPNSVEVWVRPLALRGDDEAKRLGPGPLTWPGVSLTSVSPYVIVKVVGESTVERLLVAELLGDPPARRDAILAQLIASQEGFLRYLLLLLADGALDGAFSQTLASFIEDGKGARTRSLYELPLLETLLRTLSRNPADLGRVRDLLADLQRTQEGQQLVPPEFEEIWEPISAALGILGQEGAR